MATDRLKRNREHDRRRREASPWRTWYKTAAWQRRRQHQLSTEPLCRRCAKLGRVVPATVANHVIPHRGDRALFFTGDLESLCKPCHDGPTQADEIRGYSNRVGPDGFPVDPNHPANRTHST